MISQQDFLMYFCYLKFHGHVVQSSYRFTMNNFYQMMIIIHEVPREYLPGDCVVYMPAVSKKSFLEFRVAQCGLNQKHIAKILLKLSFKCLQILVMNNFRKFLTGKKWQCLQYSNFHQYQHIYTVVSWNHPYATQHIICKIGQNKASQIEPMDN